jgi:hypothetical protein
VTAAEIVIGGVRTTHVTSFSVQEDATPIDVSSSFGGVGQITLGMVADKNSPMLLGEIVLTDGARGRTSGAVTSLASSNGSLSVTADSILGRFNTTRTAAPYSGTLSGAVSYYCNLVGITAGIVTDSTIASRAVTYPGWKGNAWVLVKQMLSKEQVEMALIGNQVYVRPLRKLVANTDLATNQAWTVSSGTAASNIEIYYYNHVYGVQREVYPVPKTDPTIYTVNAGETVTFTQQLNASLSSVNQPVIQNSVLNQSYAGTAGVYAVAGNDGLPITAAQWTAQGGSLSVAITDDPSVIQVTITGASGTQYAPYRIAMTAGASSYYNSLHITGTGVTWDKQLLTLPTGTKDPLASDAVGTTVDNPFISSLSEAYDLGIITAGAYAGNTYTITGSAYALNRNNDGNEVVAPTIADFNTAEGYGTTIATFNTEWSGQTIQAFNLYWASQVDLIWENQLFGNAIGSRILTPDANFRVNSTTTSEALVEFSATLDTLVGDFNGNWVGKTVADFNVPFTGRLVKDYNVIPLRQVA